MSYFTVRLQNQFISAGKEPVLSHTKKSCIACIIFLEVGSDLDGIFGSKFPANSLLQKYLNSLISFKNV